MNWRDYSYLPFGTDRQRHAYALLEALALLDTLRPFDPALVSTTCLNLDVQGSDLDVICEVRSPSAFEKIVREAYAEYSRFHVDKREDDTRVARFDTPAFPVEIFAAPQPVERQYAWRHLGVMKRLLRLAPSLRPRVRDLKREGFATEAAFAALLDLPGNPYDALLTLEGKTNDQLARLVRNTAIL